MRRIAIINQKGGVGKTTTAVNFGAALARLGRRVLVVDMDPQANASQNLGAELEPGEPSTYSLLTQGGKVADTVRGTSTPGLSVLPAHLDLSGAELELASAIGRETILKDALDDWENEELERSGRSPADIVLIDNPPSLGLLSVNGLTASSEVLIAVQTEFFALQGLSKLVEIVQLLRRRMRPDLEITGVLACMYDSRLRLAREVLGELRSHFPEQLFKRPIAQNVKLAETPSFSRTIFEYAPESRGAEDYLAVAKEFIEREGAESEEESRSVEAPPGARPRGPHLDWLAAQTLVTASRGSQAPPTDDMVAPDQAGAGSASPSMGSLAAEPLAAVPLSPEQPEQEVPSEQALSEEALSEEALPDEALPSEDALSELLELEVPSAAAPEGVASLNEDRAVELETSSEREHRRLQDMERPARAETTAGVASPDLVAADAQVGPDPFDGHVTGPDAQPVPSPEPGAKPECGDPGGAAAPAIRAHEDAPAASHAGAQDGPVETTQNTTGKTLKRFAEERIPLLAPPRRPVYAGGSQAAERGLERASWSLRASGGSTALPAMDPAVGPAAR